MNTLLSAESWRIAWHLAWFDTKMRYVRSLLGPFWITLQAAIFIFGISVVFSTIFNQGIERFIPFFAVSYVFWQYLTSSVLESASAIQSSSGFIQDRGKDPKIFVMKAFLHNTLIFLHSLPIVVLVYLYFGAGSFKGLAMAIPGVALYIAMVLCLVLLVAPLAARFHDTKPLLESAFGLLFFVSPIMWEPALLAKRPEFLNFNPVYHFLEIWRAPLLDATFAPQSFFISLGILGLLAAILFFSLPVYKKISLWI